MTHGIAIVLPHCETLNERRVALGWTIDDLARRAGFAVNTVRRCLEGQNVRLESFLIVAVTLGLELEVRVPPKAA